VVEGNERNQAQNIVQNYKLPLAGSAAVILLLAAITVAKKRNQI
jgi:hypothetical protein